jgi:hypothetical protein
MQRFVSTLSMTTAALALATAAHGQCSAGSDSAVAVTIESAPIASFSHAALQQRRFGKLEYIGGLVLTSSYQEFGGLSGLRVDADGQHFLALTDQGWWLAGRIVYGDHGQPAGIADARMAPMQGLGRVGRNHSRTAWYDTESLAERDGWLYVGIERVNRIVRFDFAHCGFRARASEVRDIASGIAHLPGNKGLEGLVAPAAGRFSGTLIAFSERGLDAAGNLKAFLIGPPPAQGRRNNAEFTVRRRDDFDISDAAVLPSGDLLLLERRFSWFTGLAMRLRQVAIGSIAPGALVDGTDLLFADGATQIDNMEGLSVHTDAAGGVVLTLISDDNFNHFLQRTVLMQFRLVDG